MNGKLRSTFFLHVRTFFICDEKNASRHENKMIYTIKQEAGCNKRESTPASFPPVNINEIKSFFSQDVTSIIIRVTKQ